MRINKYLAQCGLGSRRAVEKYVTEGKVKVNKKIIDSLSYEVDLENDTVVVEGKTVKPVVKHTYIMFNKPKGCICSRNDENNRKTIYDYIDIDATVQSVGRLDYDTEGMLIMTNDGDLHYRLTHPSNEIPKTYLVKINNEAEEDKLKELRKGIVLDGVQTHRAKIKLKEVKDGIASYIVVIFEGKNRQIRRMFESIDKSVVFLKRIAIGDLKLGGLSRGGFRHLTDYEVFYLKNL